MGLSPPAPTLAPSAVLVGSLRVVFAIWLVAASTDMVMVGLKVDDTKLTCVFGF